MLKSFFRKIHGGIHPYDGTELADQVPVQEAPLFEKYTVPLQQNIGSAPVLVVKKGDHVKKGQKIAEASGAVSVPLHAPTSGTVGDIVTIPGASVPELSAIEIISDGKDEWDTALGPFSAWCSAGEVDLLGRIRDAGIIGMGGAAFPTFLKLFPPPQKKIDTLILNGAECEPYLTNDSRQMTEHPESVIEGALIAAKILHVSQICLGIEQNKPDAIDTMKKRTAGQGIRVIPLNTFYPQGGEKQLIYSITGRTVPAGGLPMDVGCVVMNVATCAAVSDAVTKGHPLIERLVTVTGTPVREPGTWKLRIGTPVSEAQKLAGGIVCPAVKLIIGGPMMGFSRQSLAVAVAKNTSGILLLQQNEISESESGPCIRCGRCVDVCPMQLNPGPISVMVENGRYEQAERAYVMDCMECGSCAYVCPARRPLVQYFRLAKGEILKLRNAGK